MKLPPITAMSDLDLSGKRVLIRADLNVPLLNGAVTSDTRIRATVPTISRAIEQGASVVVMSHLGRPSEGYFDPEASLAPVAERLAELLKMPVPLLADLEQAGLEKIMLVWYDLNDLEGLKSLAGELFK